MKNFSYQNQLQEFIKDKQLVEIHLSNAPEFKVAYILGANLDFLTFAEINSAADFAGVVMCRTEVIELIKSDSIYLSELSKVISNDIYNRASEIVENLTDFTFADFLKILTDSNQIVELFHQKDEAFAGKIIGFDSEVVVLDEYYAEYEQKLARSFISLNNISRISTDIAWLRTIERVVKAKGL